MMPETRDGCPVEDGKPTRPGEQGRRDLTLNKPFAIFGVLLLWAGTRTFATEPPEIYQVEAVTDKAPEKSGQPTADLAELAAGRSCQLLDNSSCDCCSCCCPCCCCCPMHCGPKVWGGAEYLLWWIKDGPLPVPLVTTGDPNSLDFGIIGDPTTRVLFGNNDLDYGSFSGFRGTLGTWFDDQHRVGIEANAFFLERQGVIFGAESDTQGLPPLLIPFFDVDQDSESAILFANPELSPDFPTTNGGIGVTSFTRFWGSEANFLFNAVNQSGLRVDVLTGFRYLSLNEELNIYGRANIPAFDDLVARLNESFDTRNYFYGGQVGGRVRWEGEFVALMLQGMVALGGTYQVVDVSGNTILSDAILGTEQFPSGILIQASNAGRRDDTHFSVVPAVQVQLAFRLLANVRATVGYDFIFWDRVVRPGEQIDRSINLTQSPIFGTGTLVGPARPEQRFDRSDFFAHGASFGLECRY
jgi:hypothetical protein